jgi:hypothetical protein
MLTVFPNPVTVQLGISGLKPGGTLRLFAADGRIMNQKNVTTQTMILDMGSYPNGIYWLHYTYAGEIQTQKIIKK